MRQPGTVHREPGQTSKLCVWRAQRIEREIERECRVGGGGCWQRRRMRARSVQLKSVRAINNIGAFAQPGKTKRRTDSDDKRRIKKIQPAAATATAPIEPNPLLSLLV